MRRRRLDAVFRLRPFLNGYRRSQLDDAGIVRMPALFAVPFWCGCLGLRFTLVPGHADLKVITKELGDIFL